MEYKIVKLGENVYDYVQMPVTAKLSVNINELIKPSGSCYCVCHSESSSCAYCPHCLGNNKTTLYGIKK